MIHGRLTIHVVTDGSDEVYRLIDNAVEDLASDPAIHEIWIEHQSREENPTPDDNCPTCAAMNEEEETG